MFIPIQNLTFTQANSSHQNRILFLNNRDFNEPYLREHLTKGHCYVALENQSIVRGFAILSNHFFGNNLIEYVMIEKDYRNQHVAKQFIRFLEKNCISQNIYCTVPDSSEVFSTILEKNKYVASGYFYNLHLSQAQNLYVKNLRGNLVLKNMKEEIQCQKDWLKSQVLQTLKLKLKFLIVAYQKLPLLPFIPKDKKQKELLFLNGKYYDFHMKVFFKSIYLIFGSLFFSLGVIGIFLPLLPTTPFLLISLYFFSKSSTKVQLWILNHPVLGPPIIDWQSNGVIRPKAKILACILIIISMNYPILFKDLSTYFKAIIIFVELSLIIFIVSRPSKAKKNLVESKND